MRLGPTGKMYACRGSGADGARVFELYTCRQCGVAYARAYTNDLEHPSYLWAEPGEGFQAEEGRRVELRPLDLLLEPHREEVEKADLDLITGRLNPPHLGTRVRTVCLRKDRVAMATMEVEGGDARVVEATASGEFPRPCGVCGDDARLRQVIRTGSSDHRRSTIPSSCVLHGIQVQPLGMQPATPLAPHRGRKVLIFSDSRQTAIRAIGAPNSRVLQQRRVAPATRRGIQGAQWLPRSAKAAFA